MIAEPSLLLLDAPVPVYLFGTAAAIGVLIALALDLLSAKGSAAKSSVLTRYACFLPVMLLGARLCYCLARLPSLDEGADPGFFRFQDGGLTLAGALLVAPLAALLYKRVCHIPVWKALDDTTPAIALTLAACYLGKHLLGMGLSTLEVREALRFFPVSAYSADYEEWLYGTALWAFLLCLALYAPGRFARFKREGDRCQFFALILCCALIFIESVENDTSLNWGLAPTVQIFTLLVVLAIYGCRAARAHRRGKGLWPSLAALALSIACVGGAELGLDRLNVDALVFYAAMAVALALTAWLTWRIGYEQRQASPRS